MGINAFLETSLLEEEERRAICTPLGHSFLGNENDRSVFDGHGRSERHNRGFAGQDTERWEADHPGAARPIEVWLAVVDVLNVME